MQSTVQPFRCHARSPATVTRNSASLPRSRLRVVCNAREQSSAQQDALCSSRRAALAVITLAAGASPLAPQEAGAAAKRAGDAGDWSSPGLAAPIPEGQPEFYKTETGVKVQQLAVGSGPAATATSRVLVDYVLRRANGYFIYSTVEGVSFQPRDIPVGPVSLDLGSGRVVPGLADAIAGMQPGGKRRALVPPERGYLDPEFAPQPPGFAAKRQVINHRAEPLLFEVALLRVIEQ